MKKKNPVRRKRKAKAVVTVIVGDQVTITEQRLVQWANDSIESTELAPVEKPKIIKETKRSLKEWNIKK